MALREKHAWRRWLGLRGSLWYFEQPKRPKPPSAFSQPAAWSAIVAAISAILTAIFAYDNYHLTKQSYRQTHPPKLVAVSAFIVREPDSLAYYLMIRNEGDTEAHNVHATLLFLGNRDSISLNFGSDFYDIPIPAGGAAALLSPGPLDSSPKVDGDIVLVNMHYNDSDDDSDEHGPVVDLTGKSEKKVGMFCGTFKTKTSVVVLGSCNIDSWRELQKKLPPASIKTR